MIEGLWPNKPWLIVSWTCARSAGRAAVMARNRRGFRACRHGFAEGDEPGVHGERPSIADPAAGRI